MANNNWNQQDGYRSQRGMVPPRNCTIWIGDIGPEQTEQGLKDAFAALGETVTYVSIKRDRDTDRNMGYGFLGFADEQTAQRIIDSYNDQPIPNSAEGKTWRLNSSRMGWQQNHQNKPHPSYQNDRPKEFNLFVGELSHDVDDNQLMHCFQSLFKNVQSASVITTPDGVSKGFGFVRMTDRGSQQQAIMECQRNPPLLGQKQIRVSEAQPRPMTPRNWVNRGGYRGTHRNPRFEEDNGMNAQGQYMTQEQQQQLMAAGDMESYHMTYYPPVGDVPQVPGYPAFNYQAAAAYPHYGYGNFAQIQNQWPNLAGMYQYPQDAGNAEAFAAAQANSLNRTSPNIPAIVRDHGFNVGADHEALNQESISRNNDLYQATQDGRFFGANAM